MITTSVNRLYLGWPEDIIVSCMAPMLLCVEARAPLEEGEMGGEEGGQG